MPCHRRLSLCAAGHVASRGPESGSVPICWPNEFPACAGASHLDPLTISTPWSPQTRRGHLCCDGAFPGVEERGGRTVERSGARPEEGLEQAPCLGPRQLCSGGPRGGGVTPLLVATGAPTAAPTPPSPTDRF